MYDLSASRSIKSAIAKSSAFLDETSTSITDQISSIRLASSRAVVGAGSGNLLESLGFSADAPARDKSWLICVRSPSPRFRSRVMSVVALCPFPFSIRTSATFMKSSVINAMNPMFIKISVAESSVWWSAEISESARALVVSGLGIKLRSPCLSLVLASWKSSTTRLDASTLPIEA